MTSSHQCSHCGEPHIVKDSHKEHLNKHKLTMLQTAARHVINTKVNDFKKRDLEQSGDMPHSFYGNWQKLRYHGLVTQVRVDGTKIKDRWLITRQGWEFLRGVKDLPTFVLVKDNHIKHRSEQLINVKDVYRGSEIIETSFEYFDEAGNPVGIRPLVTKPKSDQLGLL